MKERDKEISSNLERIRRLEADKDRLEEEVKRLTYIPLSRRPLYLYAKCVYVHQNKLVRKHSCLSAKEHC